MLITIEVAVILIVHCVIRAVEDRALYSLEWLYRESIMICILQMSKLMRRRLEAVWFRVTRRASGDTGIQQDFSPIPVHSLRHCPIPISRNSLEEMEETHIH